MDAAAAIERALPAFSTVQPGDWAGLRAALAAAGVPAALVSDITAFVPIAFGRALLDGMGIGFSPEYAVADDGAGVRIAGRLIGHPVYVAAAAKARQILALRQGGDAFVAAAVWSSEFAAVNQALHAGSNPSGLEAGPPVILQDAEPAGAPAGKRPWWRFRG
jgi:hypothetical protein